MELAPAAVDEEEEAAEEGRVVGWVAAVEAAEEGRCGRRGDRACRRRRAEEVGGGAKADEDQAEEIVSQHDDGVGEARAAAASGRAGSRGLREGENFFFF